MPFHTPLSAKKISEASSLGRARWLLQEDLVYLSKRRGLIVVPKGFVTDFATVFRLPLAFWLTGDTAHASATVHDWLVHSYVVDRKGWIEAAKVFREAMADEGVPGWRRLAMYLAVRYLGGRDRDADE